MATGWTVRGSNSGGGEIFRPRPDRPLGSPTFLYTGFPYLSRIERGRSVALTTNAHVAPWLKKEESYTCAPCVGLHCKLLYLYSWSPLIRKLVIRKSNYPDQLGTLRKFIANSTKLICLKLPFVLSSTVQCYGFWKSKYGVAESFTRRDEVYSDSKYRFTVKIIHLIFCIKFNYYHIQHTTNYTSKYLSPLLWHLS